jgi:hypothetical protein
LSIQFNIKKRGLRISTFILILFIAGCFITCFYSCDLVNPAERIPTFIQVDTFSFSVLPGQGTSSTKITDVWVFDENSIVGAYEMPKTFPIIDSGSTRIIFSAGIWDNGISETRVEYPFYYPDTTTLNLKPGKTLMFTPHFTYRPSTKFYFIEDFEAGNLFNKINGDTNMIRITGAANVFEGGGSGAIFLDPDHRFYEGRTSSSYILPKGQPVYLEMNYKCDQAFEVGLYGTLLATTIFYYKWKINPKDYWNKIYLNMGNDVNSFGADNYQILIRANYDSTETTSHIYVDNIKLVSF